MSTIQQNSLNFNKNISYNFDGGDLSSDTGLLAIRSFIEQLGLIPLLNSFFNDGINRIHTLSQIIEQIIYTNISGYHQDSAANELRHDPILTNILGKESLASQPTISRAINNFNEKDINSFNEILKFLFEKGNNPKDTKNIVLDIDTTIIGTYGKQEDSEYIYHYSANGYHPIVLYNGINGDIMKFQLRKGNMYCSNGAADFLRPVFEWLDKTYPEATILLRADSGFAVPEIYKLAEEYGVSYVIKLKSNQVLRNLATYNTEIFQELYGSDFSKAHKLCDDFYYQAGSWDTKRRVVCITERAALDIVPITAYVVTSLEAHPEKVINVYNKRGNMENFIKETKLDFGLDTLSHSTFIANYAKAMILAIAYSIINIMKRLVLPDELKTSRMLSIRSIFIKIACRVAKSAVFGNSKMQFLAIRSTISQHPFFYFINEFVIR